MNKKDILAAAFAAREEELLGYQINIDNYRLAVEHINASGDADLLPFREQLQGLLTSEVLEQKKARVIWAVIKQQLDEMQ